MQIGFGFSLLIDEKNDSLSSRPSRNGKRCSDKGFLALSDAEYLTILDWIARNTVAGKRGQIPVGAPSVFERLGIDAQEWSRLVKCSRRSPRNREPNGGAISGSLLCLGSACPLAAFFWGLNVRNKAHWSRARCSGPFRCFGEPIRRRWMLDCDQKTSDRFRLTNLFPDNTICTTPIALADRRARPSHRFKNSWQNFGPSRNNVGLVQRFFLRNRDR